MVGGGKKAGGPSVGLWVATAVLACGVGVHAYMHYVQGVNILKAGASTVENKMPESVSSFLQASRQVTNKENSATSSKATASRDSS